MKFILFIITFFLNISFILAETFYLNMYFKFDDREVLNFSENEKYIQFKASANWEDSERLKSHIQKNASENAILNAN